MYFPREQLRNLKRLLLPGKVVVLYGPRQVGKTTLAKKMLEEERDPFLYVTGEDIVVREFLGSRSISKLREFVGGRKLLVVDEAQHVPGIGLNLKMLVDSIPGLRVLATGSSSFKLTQETGEALTGRQYTLRLYPLSHAEIAEVEHPHEVKANLESRLIYGSYPEVVVCRDNELRARYLKDLVHSYLLKDILVLDGVRHSDKLLRLLQLLAHQVGAEVSASELGRSAGLAKNTVERYLDLLRKVFVLHRMDGFSRNLRKELVRNPRYYFLDVGVRNTLVNNYNPVSLRNDVGALWENYIVMERIKGHEASSEPVGTWFWRTYDRQEIDLIEERSGKLHGYEIKWAPGRGRRPRAWTAAYPDASFSVVHSVNYAEFLSRRSSAG